MSSEQPNILSRRECEVALLVAHGLSNKEIARDLDLSEGTIKQHVRNMLQKLGAKKRHSIILWQYQQGTAGRAVA
jgi:two-component system nitrate/nitrite response regulator NarL